MLVGEIYADILRESLEKYGISVISVPDNPHIAPQVSSHADMSACYLGEGRLVAARGVFDELKARCDLEIIEAQREQRPEYPDDVSLNACIFGGRLLHALKNTDGAVLEAARGAGYECIDVKQGYTKCSVCVLARDAIITGDAGIHALAGRLGVKSLLISAGHIALPGYGTGFIGGCCGKLSEGRIAFTGRLDEHPDGERILDFIAREGLEAVFLTEKPLFDVGSLLPIEEYC